MRPSRASVYMGMAVLLSHRSTCPRRKVGCLLTDVDGRILSTGYNGVPAHEPHCSEDHSCPGVGFPSGQGLDLCEAIHAEQNALLLLPDPRKLYTAYVTTFPCRSCLKLLLGTNCQEIFYRESYSHAEALTWWTSRGRRATQQDPFFPEV